MKKILSCITAYFTQQKLWKVFLVGGLIIAGVTFAQENSGSGDSDMAQAIIQVMDIIFGLLSLLLTPVIILSGWLLSPDWTMGDFFGLRPYFRDVWILVSNIVYIVFAMMLLYMAIMQIFGGGEAEYAIKKKIPQFLVGILIVPFTWLIVSWTLSFANQAVAAVLSIPMGAISQIVSSQNPEDPEHPPLFHKKVIPTKLNFSLGDDNPGATPETVNCQGGEVKAKDGSSIPCISPAEFVKYNQAGPFFIIMVYAYDVFKIQTVPLADVAKVCKTTATSENAEGNAQFADSRTCVRNLMGLVRKFGLSLITMIFFGILLIALCWVLLMRAFKLWIYIMFSPLFGLAYFTGEGWGQALHSDGGGESSGLTSVGFIPFLKLAMVPVLVSAVLAFGLLFVGVVGNSFTGGTSEKINEEICTTGDFLVKYCISPSTNNKDDYASRLVIGTAVNDQGKPDDKYVITFSFGDTLSGVIGGNDGIAGAVGGTVDSIQDIFAHVILTIMSLVIIWMGVKAAVHHDAVTDAAFRPFAKFGESVGHFVQHIPSYLPLPHPAFKALTPAGIGKVADIMRTTIDQREFEDGKKLAEIINTKGAAMKFSSDVDSASSSVKEFSKVLDSATQTDMDGLNAFNGLKKGLLNSLKSIESTITPQLAPKFNMLLRDIEGTENRSQIRQFITDPENKELVDKLKENPEIRVILSKFAPAGATSSGSAIFGNVKVEGNTIKLGDSNPQINLDGTLTTQSIDPSKVASIQHAFSVAQINTSAEIDPLTDADPKLKKAMADILGEEATNKLISTGKIKVAAKALLDRAGGSSPTPPTSTPTGVH